MCVLTLIGNQFQVAFQQNQIDIFGKQMFPFLDDGGQLDGAALSFLGNNKRGQSAK